VRTPIKEWVAISGIALFVFSLIFAVKSVHGIHRAHADVIRTPSARVQYINMEPMEFTPAAQQAAELRNAPRCEPVSYVQTLQ
jgi:hypothetical protein